MIKKLMIILILTPFILLTSSCGGDGNNHGQATSRKDVAHGWNGLTFRTTEGGYQIFSISASTPTNIDLPTTVNGTPIVSIWTSAFANHGFNNVNFSRMTYLRTIGASAFSGNQISNLVLANLPNFRQIDPLAFADNPIQNLVLDNLPLLTLHISSLQGITVVPNATANVYNPNAWIDSNASWWHAEHFRNQNFHHFQINIR